MYEAPAPKKRSNLRLILLIFGGVLIVIAIILGALSSTSGPEDKFMAAVFKNHDSVASYALIGDEMKKELDQESWNRRVEQYEKQFTNYKLAENTGDTDQETKTSYRYFTYNLTPREEGYRHWVTLEYSKKSEESKFQLTGINFGKLKDEK